MIKNHRYESVLLLIQTHIYELLIYMGKM